MYRCLVEGLFGVQGDKDGLLIRPQLPSHWSHVKLTRTFRGATFHIQIIRQRGLSATVVTVDEQPLATNKLTAIQAGRTYSIHARVPVHP